MRIDSRRLAHFVAVVDAGGVREAARRIRIAQPALSRTIAELEEDLGVVLFEHVGRRIVPTDAGLRIAADARVVLAELEGLVARTQALSRGATGRLRVGSSPSATFHPSVPALVRRFRERHPGVALELTERGSTELVEAVVGRTIDVALVRRAVPKSADLASITLADERLVVVVASSHPFASVRTVSMARVLAEPLLLPPARSGSSLSYVVEEAARELGAELRVAATATHVASLVHLAAIGMGAALVPASVAAMRTKGVRAVRLASRARLPLVLVHRPELRLPSVRAFVTLARDVRRASMEAEVGERVATVAP